MVKLLKIIDNISNPVQITNANDNSNRLFIVEQRGRILILKDNKIQNEPFLDIESIVNSGGEKGLLSVAFHPEFNKNQRFFVNYTKLDERQLKTVVAEYNVSATNPNIANTEEKVILEIDQPFGNHNGGQIMFGPDGFLYVGMGDGGSGGDPLNNGQNINTVLGSLLRIDVNRKPPFEAPPGNPFVGVEGANEIWAYGLRNPWRFSFDRENGNLFLADVGQNDFEEVNLITRGGNYGWNVMEGFHCFPLSNSDCDQPNFIPPLAEYSHGEGNSITGGYVYRGLDINELVGNYIFGDFVSSTIWTLNENQEGIWERTELLQTNLSISSFGEDEAGELYVVDHSGAIYKMIDANEEDGSGDDMDDDGDGKENEDDGENGNGNEDGNEDDDEDGNKSFTFNCNQDLIKSKFGFEKLTLNFGDTENCALKITNPNQDTFVQVLTSHKTGPHTAVEITPTNGNTDNNNLLEFAIKAIDKGVDWIAFAIPNKNGKLEFTKKAYDEGFAWGMFVEVVLQAPDK